MICKMYIVPLINKRTNGPVNPHLIFEPGIHAQNLIKLENVLDMGQGSNLAHANLLNATSFSQKAR